MSSCLARDNTHRSSGDEHASASIASRARVGLKPTASHVCADAPACITTLPRQARISPQAGPAGVGFKLASLRPRAAIAGSAPVFTPYRLAAGVLAVVATSAILALIEVLTRSP
jgi:hypothetical protein